MPSRVYWGLALLAGGLLLLASNFGFIQPFSVWDLWPLLVIWPATKLIFGEAILVSRRGTRRERIRLGRSPGFLIVGLWVLAGAFGQLLHNLRVIPFDWGDIAYWTLPLLLVGLGLAVMFRSRRRLFEWERPGWRAGTTPGQAPGGAPGVETSGTSALVGDLCYGARPWVFKSPMRVSLLAGDLEMDLTTARLDPGDNFLTVRCWAGDVSIRVPENVEVTVEARASAGELRVFDEYREGVGPELKVYRPGGGRLDEAQAAGRVRLFIGVDLTFGNVRIR